MSWNVRFTTKALKQAKQLNEDILSALARLTEHLKIYGPAPGKRWHNYGKLHGKIQEDNRHCHLVKGHPTYVCCWRVLKSENYIEVYYVGTHEKAPY
ncbi:hypothetical protein AYO45_00355 [Gammaproteobacteria bacterium SCGC AG-212-F23]|nr:hypothetical protein AYO45_00355 [Gammaproteobacteria bacterium SCGC AG-212-F23]